MHGVRVGPGGVAAVDGEIQGPGRGAVRGGDSGARWGGLIMGVQGGSDHG